MKATSPVIHVSWLIKYLVEKGVPTGVILAGADLPRRTHLPTLKCLPLLSYRKLLNVAVEFLNDDNLGLNMSKAFHLEDAGHAGLTAIHCTTLRDSLRSIQQYQAIISQGIDIVFKESPTTSTLTYRHLLPAGEDIRHDVEQTLAFFVQSTRRAFGDDWRPLRVDFIHTQPSDVSRHIEEFGHSVCFFSQPCNRITFNTECLNAKLSNSDPELQRQLRENVKKMLNEARREDSLLTNVRYYTAMFRSSPHFGAELVSDLVHMSRRSLTRHLKDLGTSFSQIKEDVTLELSKTALLAGHVNLNVIALELGFSNATAFSRSFKKSTGLTPTEYREKALTPGVY